MWGRKSISSALKATFQIVSDYVLQAQVSFLNHYLWKRLEKKSLMRTKNSWRVHAPTFIDFCWLLLTAINTLCCPGEFNCEVECDGQVTIKGTTTTGEVVVTRGRRTFHMHTCALSPPGPFSVAFHLPGPVEPGEFTGTFATDGILEGIVLKQRKSSRTASLTFLTWKDRIYFFFFFFFVVIGLILETLIKSSSERSASYTLGDPNLAVQWLVVPRWRRICDAS